MKIDLVFITYNRLEYTKLAISSLLADPTEEFSLTIWDNGSTDGTREYLSSLKDGRISRTVFSEENVRLHGAVNDVVSRSNADLFGIVFDDFIVSAGWTRPLAKAHEEVPEFGLIGCWYFQPDEFDYERCKHKIQTFGGHQVLRHPWTGVGAGLVKVKTMKECGPIPSSRTTSYWIQMALRGYVNGYYYPLVYAEHFDYPWSEYFPYRGRFDEWLEKSSGAKRHGIKTLEDAQAWHELVLRNILEEPWDVRHYVGLRGKVRQGTARLRQVLTGSRF